MFQKEEFDRLTNLIAEYERNSNRTSWLLRRLMLKIRYFPRDYSRRLRRSIQKRRIKISASRFNESNASNLKNSYAVPRAMDRFVQAVPESILNHVIGHQVSGSKSDALLFAVNPDGLSQLATLQNEDAATRSALTAMGDFFQSEKMFSLVNKAAALDPEVGTLSIDLPVLCPHWNDVNYIDLQMARDLIPSGHYDAVVLMPAGRMGGADLVAAVLADVLAKNGRTLILRTDDSHWDRPDWYPENVPTVDLSDVLKNIGDARRAFYVLLSELGAKRIYNVNSRLAFDTFVSYGARMATQFKLYAYYFCADRTEHGLEVGYPVWYFANIFPHLTAALIDTQDLAQKLIKRYALPADQAQKVVTIYSPALTPIADSTVILEHKNRPTILWGGRLDRQKRFDLATAIACEMPDVDFLCWGKAVLDQAPDLRSLPANMTINPPFKNYEELPISSSDGWLYTSSWDGLPTILIELGALGVPIVASAVGGVPELIDETTGWPVAEDASVSDYVAAIRALLYDPDERAKRARNLQERVRERHSTATYAAMINAI